MKTVQYLEAAKVKLGIDSDYKLAKRLRITASAVSRYRKRGTTFDSMTATKIAQILEIPPMRVIADAELERAKSTAARTFWGDVLGKVAAIVIAPAVALVAIAYSADVAAAVQAAQRHLCKIARRWFAQVHSRLFQPFDHPAAALPPFAAAFFCPVRP